MLFHRKVAVFSVAFLGPILANCGSGSSPDRGPIGTSGGDNTGLNRGTPVQVDPNDAISFANDVQPIFDLRCTRCHNPITHSGMMDLTPGNSYANLVNVPTSPACRQQVPDSVRVVPFDVQGSMIFLKTNPETGRCGNPMPNGTQGLGTFCVWDESMISGWIAQGAQNN
jgi:hypothetical protein